MIEINIFYRCDVAILRLKESFRQSRLVQFINLSETVVEPVVGKEAEIISLKESFTSSATTTTAETTAAATTTTSTAASFVKIKIINTDQCKLHHISPYHMCANTIENPYPCTADEGGKYF